MTDTTVLRADRWVDVEAGEVRTPAVLVVEGKRIAAVNPAHVPSAPAEIDLGDVTLLPGLMDMEINLPLGGPNTASPVRRAVHGVMKDGVVYPPKATK